MGYQASVKKSKSPKDETTDVAGLVGTFDF
jgi:hypothetical protein